jgi:long-subunit fatty acid transport protein
VLIVLGLAAVIAILLVVTSAGGGKKASNRATATSNAPSAQHRNGAKPAAFNNATVTVAVLNGTSTAGLAGKTATRLAGVGFKKGTVATATDQTRTATVVAYLPGHHNDALAVAKNLKLGPASVQPIDRGTQAVACPPPAPCSATVVVTVGADLKNQ